MTVVLDASALLAVLLEEPGSDLVIDVMRGSALSALNASECIARAVDRGFAASSVMTLFRQAEIAVVPFDMGQAVLAADLRPKTRHAGASLGDRACLALALTRLQPVITGDRRLAELDLGIDIRLIR
ncbi:type II toxin-antitoxin system VapC family toxin [Sphingomonas bacterium]|uniref:type II toxin-antitoxin system VapC family toxin n=1 Tax=Sphingomonas bacterium TaxID=1895847 RepID=UPI0015767A6C|nr:type II toxin-antitoxin system VapC family toxin [Sphingomonas bacterium]